MIPEIKNVITQDDGKPYGVVTGVHRNNAFMFNKGILADNDLEPPTTVAEFLEVCAALKEAGITPVASDMDTWVLRILFDEILAGTMGAQGFDDFIKGKVKADDADVQASLVSAIDTFDMVITDYVDVEKSSAEDYDWSSAAQDLYDGNAAMLFHGDWAKGYLVHLGWEPGVDFGVSGPPGANDLFVYGADMFGLPSTAPHTQLGKDFLAVVASPEGQIAFNSFKGATPMRSDIIDDITDQTLKDSLNNLANAKVLMPGHANAGWDMGIEAFAMDHDKEALLKVYTETAP
jgi:glucose/mannose transport system substrate-binding protein